MPRFGIGGSAEKPEVDVKLKDHDVKVTAPESTVGADVETKGFSLKFGKKDKKDKKKPKEKKPKKKPVEQDEDEDEKK